MELEQVHKYIERYFEGETSLEEEQTLVAYFSQSEVAKSLLQYKPYFIAITQQRDEHSLVKFSPVTKSKKVRLKHFAAVAAAAIAGVLVLQQTTVTPQPTPEEIAFEEFKINMYLVAEQLNKGMQGVAYIENFNQATNKYLITE